LSRLAIGKETDHRTLRLSALYARPDGSARVFS
jgi:hypothetical protein